MKNFTIAVAPEGEVTMIYSDAMVELMDQGEAQVTRASHVEPGVHGGWVADMAPVGGPLLGPYRLREEALQAEVAWLETKLF